MNTAHRIRSARERRGWSQQDLAKAAGTRQQNIDRIESGEVKHSRYLPAVLRVLGLVDSETSSQAVQVPVVGYVGAGAEVFAIDDHAKGGALDFVSVPAGVMSISSVAVIVRGESMLPVYRDGDLIFYETRVMGNLDNLVGKTCVVRLADGRTLLKDLYKAGPGYTLISHNAAPILAPIEWAAAISWVKKS